MFRFTQLLQSLVTMGNRVAEERISQLDETSAKELTTIRLRPETKAYLQAQSESVGASLSQVINMILDGVVSMEMKPAADNKIKGIYDRVMSLFELHNINPIDMAKMLSGYGIKLSHIRNPDAFIDNLSMDMIKDIADWFSVDEKWIVGETEQMYSQKKSIWYKNAYGFSLTLLEKSFRHPDFKVFVVKGDNISFKDAEKFDDQDTRLDVGFILSYQHQVNGVKFTKYEVSEFQKWNYVKCRGYLRFIFYFLDFVGLSIKCQGVSFSEEVVDGLVDGRLIPSKIKGMFSDIWFFRSLIGDLKYNFEIEESPVEYLGKFDRLKRLISNGSSVYICGIECTTKDFSYGWMIKYTRGNEFYSEFYRDLSTGLDDIYDKYIIENPSLNS